MIEINGLKFTYPGIDGHPPPGSTPLIEDFSLSLHSGDRCLLVGSNGAGLFYGFFFHTLFFSLILLFVWFPRKWREIKSKLEIEILMYWFLGSIIMGFVQFLFFSHSEFPWISVYLPRKWRKGKYKIGNRDFDGIFLGLNYIGAHSICISPSEFPWCSAYFNALFGCWENGGEKRVKVEPETLLFVTYLYCSVFVLSIVPFIFRIFFDTLICLMLHLVSEKMKTKKKVGTRDFGVAFVVKL